MAKQTGDGAAGAKTPAQVIRLGRLTATIWENHTPPHGKWFSVTFKRSYKEGNQWKSAQTFGRDEVLVVAELARLSYLWISKQQGADIPDFLDEATEDEAARPEA